jgi:hypothetical protein
MATTTKSQAFGVPLPREFYPLKSASSKVEEKLVPTLSDIPLPPPSKAPREILNLDKGTPDHHVPRDSRLIRLTGAHPFNVEAPLTTLFNEGTSISVLSHAPIDH